MLSITQTRDRLSYRAIEKIEFCLNKGKANNQKACEQSAVLC